MSCPKGLTHSGVPLYFSRNKHVNHIELLHAITEQNMDLLLEHHIGPEWERLYDERHPEVEPQTAQKNEPEIRMAGLSLDL